jgi:hypothetical protein
MPHSSCLTINIPEEWMMQKVLRANEFPFFCVSLTVQHEVNPSLNKELAWLHHFSSVSCHAIRCFHRWVNRTHRPGKKSTLETEWPHSSASVFISVWCYVTTWRMFRLCGLRPMCSCGRVTLHASWRIQTFVATGLLFPAANTLTVSLQHHPSPRPLQIHKIKLLVRWGCESHIPYTTG